MQAPARHEDVGGTTAPSAPSHSGQCPSESATARRSRSAPSCGREELQHVDPWPCWAVHAARPLRAVAAAARGGRAEFLGPHQEPSAVSKWPCPAPSTASVAAHAGTGTVTLSAGRTAALNGSDAATASSRPVSAVVAVQLHTQLLRGCQRSCVGCGSVSLSLPQPQASRSRGQGGLEVRFCGKLPGSSTDYSS